MLKIKDLNKKFGDRTVLNNITLEIEHGEIALLLGPSGSGKSTLLRILNNLESCDSGSFYLDGKLLNLEEIHKKRLIGLVFQQFNLFNHLTVLGNITLPLEKVAGKSKNKAQEIAIKLLNDYGFVDKKDEYPSALSGGEKQRLALARALSLQPKIICLDEPTSALDPTLAGYIAQTIEGLAKQDYIVIVTTHDLKLLERLACTIHLMKKGKIVESVPSSTFFSNKSKYPAIKEFIEGQN